MKLSPAEWKWAVSQGLKAAASNKRLSRRLASLRKLRAKQQAAATNRATLAAAESLARESREAPAVLPSGWPG